MLAMQSAHRVMTTNICVFLVILVLISSHYTRKYNDPCTSVNILKNQFEPSLKTVLKTTAVLASRKQHNHNISAQQQQHVYRSILTVYLCHADRLLERHCTALLDSYSWLIRVQWWLWYRKCCHGEGEDFRVTKHNLRVMQGIRLADNLLQHNILLMQFSLPLQQLRTM